MFKQSIQRAEKYQCQPEMPTEKRVAQRRHKEHLKSPEAPYRLDHSGKITISLKGMDSKSTEGAECKNIRPDEYGENDAPPSDRPGGYPQIKVPNFPANNATKCKNICETRHKPDMFEPQANETNSG